MAAHHHHHHQKQIAIIGAGISGLLACKYALSKGFNPTVFESQNGVGGLWANTLPTTKLQTPKSLYQFSDFPWPESVATHFPTHDQVLDYLQSYADHFELTQHIKFNTKVIGIEYRGVAEEEVEAWALCGGNGDVFGSRGGKWEVEVRRSDGSEETEMYEADFVILCVGKYSGVPNIPDFPPGKGPEAFKGKVIHSTLYSGLEAGESEKLVKGKRVAVVGFRKHAMDIAMECSGINGKGNPCRVLYRTERWSFPDWFPPFPCLYLSRFSELLIHKPGEGLLLSLLATILSPIRWGISKFVEREIKRKHPLEKHGLVPKQSFLQDEGIEFEGGDKDENHHQQQQPPPLEADLVILATGFKGEKKLQDIFGSKRFREIIVGPPNATVPLYRQCIPPRIPQLAVLGHSESIANLYTSEMRSRWLAELLDGKFRLPAIEKMEADAANWDVFFKEYAGESYHRSSIATVHVWYNDQLCKDMGWNPRRKNGLWAELFEPYGPTDYVSP
ncbi:unnamed protein product [Linum trigynum]|uniref:Flavin-containing monooxygenase n=1 Tax=Linum trigynum TaxID=586398 RepID=A0AAV2DIJ7_9ROSI